MSEIASRLLAWHARHGRHDLPWQQPRTPYRVWVSEVMLQQTQVATVIGYFERFMRALPDLPALAAADIDTVLGLWSGLGYYRRAHHLHAAARACVAQHGGRLPRDRAALEALPGIGRSTAAAILALAHGERAAILDGNVKRVLARHWAVAGWPGEAAVARRLWALAEEQTPRLEVAAYTQAIMDLGATVCTPRAPDCARCPLRASCAARAQGRVEELPTPRPRRRLPQRRTWMLVALAADGRVLLHRRAADGVWPGLWSLPEAAAPEAGGALLARHAVAASPPRDLPPLEHGFTHFRLTIHPRLWTGVTPVGGVGETGDWRWAAPAELESLGIPAAVRRVLAAAADTPGP